MQKWEDMRSKWLEKLKSLPQMTHEFITSDPDLSHGGIKYTARHHNFILITILKKLWLSPVSSCTYKQCRCNTQLCDK